MSSKNRPPYEQESALFGFGRVLRQAYRPVRLKILWHRVFAALVALAVAGWFAGAGALYFFFKYKHGYDAVKYSNMLVLPFRLDEHRIEMGNYHVQQGLKALEEGEFRTAIHLLRIGVARSRANMEGRLALAQIFHSGLRRPEAAVSVLKEGLDYASVNPEFLNEDYIRGLVQLMLLQEMDQELIQISEELLDTLPSESRQVYIVAFATIQAYIYQGQYDEAERLLDQYNLIRSPEGRWMLAQIRWNRGQRDRAIAILHRTLEQAPDRTDIYSNLMRYYRNLEKWDLMRRYAVLRTIRFPDQVGPQIDLLYALKATGETEEMNRQLQSILMRFPAENVAGPLSFFAAETGLPEVSRIAYDIALQENMDLSTFTLHFLEAYIRAGDYAKALEFSDQLAEDKPEWLSGIQNIENGMRALALKGLGRSIDSRIYVREFLRNDRVRPQTHIAVAKLFKELGHPEIAREILLMSFSRNPSNQPVLSALVETEIDLSLEQSFIDHLKQLLRMRVPDQELLTRAYRELGSDRHLFLPERELLLSRIEELMVRQS